jgi:hypothetical protein
MKKIIISLLILLFANSGHSQACYQQIPPCPDSTCMWGCTLPLKQILNESDFVFEGHILTDSFFCNSQVACVYHRVLVLKEFKGDFKSDTLEIAQVGGNKGCKDPFLSSEMPNVHPGTEGVFFVGKVTKYTFNQNPNIYAVLWLKDGCVNVCDKKDVVKEVYEPIEAATGQPYVDVHPNTCATQQKPKK